MGSSAISGGTGTFTQVDITAEGDLRLQDNSGGQYVGIDAPSSVSSSYTLTMPSAVGSVNQVLSLSNTDGTLAWSTPEVGDITGVTAGDGLSGGGTSGAVSLALDLNELTAATVNVANDSIAIVDASDSNTSRKETIADLMSAVDGNWADSQQWSFIGGRIANSDHSSRGIGCWIDCLWVHFHINIIHRR